MLRVSSKYFCAGISRTHPARCPGIYVPRFSPSIAALLAAADRVPPATHTGECVTAADLVGLLGLWDRLVSAVTAGTVGRFICRCRQDVTRGGEIFLFRLQAQGGCVLLPSAEARRTRRAESGDRDCEVFAE
jgi:hypothetical protein